MKPLIYSLFTLFLCFAFAPTASAQFPKIKKPTIKTPKIPKVGGNKSGSTTALPTDSPAKSDMTNFDKHAVKLQYCLDNGVWQDQNSNQFKSILGYAKTSLDAIEKKDAKKAPAYKAQYDKYAAAWDKQLDVEAEAKGIRRKKADVSASPAAATIKKFRSALSFAKDDVKRKYDGAGTRVENCEKLLAQIKEEDPNWVEYEIDKADFMDIKTQYEKDQFTKASRSQFEGYGNATSMLEREPWQYKGYASKLDYNKFMAEKKAYMDQDNQNDYVIKLIGKTDAFFESTRPKVLEEIKKDLEEIIKNSNFMNKNARAKDDYLSDRFNTSWSPDGPIKKLDGGLEICKIAYVISPDYADVKAIQSRIEAQKADIEQYKTSGQFDKDVATKKQMIIDAERLDKALMSDASLNAILKRDINGDKYGSVLRINITSRDWNVRKNNIDLPTEKVLYVECAAKKDGKCYRVTGKFIKTYEGGGTYGKPYYVTQNRFEMNCNNVNK